MNIINNLKRVARTGVILGVVAASLVGAGLIAGRTTKVEAATNCAAADKVNVIYCGLDTSSLSSEISSLKADYDTNVSGHAASPTIRHDFHDVQTIFNFVGANKTLVDSMTTSNTVAGAVMRNGDVVVSGRVIATGAKVAARFSVPGAVAIPGTNAFLRTTTSSFAHDSEAAIIREDSNGKMLYASIIGCGNAVQAMPVVTPKPAYTIIKEVAVKGSSTYAKDVNVKSGTHVVYRITVASTGNAPVTNLNVKDALPAHVQYVTGTLKRDNVVASTSFFSTGILLSSLRNGTSTVFTFEGIVGATDTPQVCTTETLNNVGTMTATGLPTEDSTATVNKACLPKPVFICTSLTPQMVSRAVFNFTAKANAQNGAVINSYHFDLGDGNEQVVTSAAASTVLKHTYAAPGIYTITVSVTFTVPGLAGTQTVTADSCKTQVTVKPAPAAECTDLTLIKNTSNSKEVTANVIFNVTGDVHLTNISFNWGDNSAVTDNGVSTSATHTFQTDGTFNVVATLTFSNGVAKSTCEQPVSYVTPPVTPPTTLVNTGAGSTFGLFAVVATVSTLGYRFFTARRLS